MRDPRRSSWHPRLAGRLLTALVGCAVSLAGHATDHVAAPWLPYRDSNPFVAASGLPFAPPALAPDSWRIDVLLAASNTEIAFDRSGEHLLYDAEVHEARIAVTRAFGERWLVRATIAGTRFGHGFLDGFIEDFHRVFGFGNGDRGRLGSGSPVIRHVDAAGHAIELDRGLGALSPLLVDVVMRTARDGHEWLYGATVKLPISRSSVLVDDRAVDLSLWLAAQSNADTRFPWGARLGVMQRGSTRLLAHRARDRVPFADAMLGWRLHPRWDISAQLQWHRGLYDSDIPLLGSAATLTLSTGWRTRSGWTWRVGLVEDATPRRAQDVTFFAGLTL